jgi:hypothetical protein
MPMPKGDERNQLDPGHEATQAVLRIVGPLMIGAGVLFSAIGFISFFSSFGTFEPPRYFWCVFLGFPLLALGAAVTKFAFLGSVLRYMAGEVAPVGKDTFNDVAEGTSEGIRTIARAVGQGISSGLGQPATAEARCPSCSEPNPVGTRFCGHCGASIEARACPRCGHPNEPAAQFCNQCGGPLHR